MLKISDSYLQRLRDAFLLSELTDSSEPLGLMKIFKASLGEKN